jgi:FkbM family methyltransferase
MGNNASNTQREETTLSGALELIIRQYQEGSYNQAIDIAKQVSQAVPSNGIILQLIAAMYRCIGQQDEADIYRQQALSSNTTWECDLIQNLVNNTIRPFSDVLVPLREVLQATSQNSSDAHDLSLLIWQIDKIRDQEAPYFSQAGQDKFLDQTVFSKKSNGFFLDIGAHDGINGSNTLHFEKFRNWTGICIEASPAIFKNLKKNRAIDCLNMAVSDTIGEADFLEVTDALDQMSGLVDSLRPGHTDLVKNWEGSNCTQISVPVTTIAALAKKRDLRNIDYCSIDVEGAELNVLQGIDFEFTKIQVISIENPKDFKTQQNPIREFLEAQNFYLVESIGHDDIFLQR